MSFCNQTIWDRREDIDLPDGPSTILWDEKLAAYSGLCDANSHQRKIGKLLELNKREEYIFEFIINYIIR